MQVGPYGRALGFTRAWEGESSPDSEAGMQSDPFLDFHQTAERAGFPAMLIVSMVALGLVVAPVLVLALTRAVWMLVISVLSIFAALALLAGEVGASFADGDQTVPRSAGGEPPQGTTSPRRMA